MEIIMNQEEVKIMETVLADQLKRREVGCDSLFEALSRIDQVFIDKDNGLICIPSFAIPMIMDKMTNKK